MGRKKRSKVFLAIAAFMLLLPAVQADAFTLYEKNGWNVKLDTTLTYGLMLRVEDPDSEQIGVANGGTGDNPNWDDGNLNYDKGVVSNLVKVTSEFDAARENYGVFLRGTAFYDFENMDGDRERTPLDDGADEQVGKDVELLDAFVWGRTDVGDMPVQLRVGDQVVNWGESTFILGGIGLNTINPINTGALRAPGAELKEAILPVGMVTATVGLTENLNIEGLYVYDWEETQLDESGTYFSVIDFAGEDGKKVLAANVADNGVADADMTFMAVPRAGGVEPGDDDQFGLALRYYAPWLNDTEFGLYWQRYHSKMPTLSVKTGTVQGAADGQAAAGQVYANAGVAPGADPNVDALAQAVALNEFLKTAGYRVNFEEDLDVFALGFNTELFGWGVQGEVSHRQDVPLQIDDTELLFAVVGAINPTVAALNQAGDYYGEFDTWIPSVVESDMTQTQFTISKLLGPVFGSEGSAFLAEVGWLHVHDMPEKNDLRLETFGPFGTGNALLGPAFGVDIESSNNFPDEDSWGYVLYGELQYRDVIGDIDLKPKFSFAHDVHGISPNGGPFIEDRKSTMIGVEAEYRNNWFADLSYTNFFGAGKLNQINDRDYVAFNIKYTF